MCNKGKSMIYMHVYILIYNTVIRYLCSYSSLRLFNLYSIPPLCSYLPNNISLLRNLWQLILSCFSFLRWVSAIVITADKPNNSTPMNEKTCKWHYDNPVMSACNINAMICILYSVNFWWGKTFMTIVSEFGKECISEFTVAYTCYFGISEIWLGKILTLILPNLRSFSLPKVSIMQYCRVIYYQGYKVLKIVTKLL